MTPATRTVFRIAIAITPAAQRDRLREEWGADLIEATALGFRPLRYTLGLTLAASRLRARSLRRRRARVIALIATVAVLGAGASVTALVAPRPVCSTPRETLAVVAGSVFDGTGRLPERALAAMRAVGTSGGYEGVWVDRAQSVFVGVYGPAWPRAREAAIAVASVPGPRITFVCQPATSRQLHSAQDKLGDSPLWQQRVVGFSNIDVQRAVVTVGITASAPSETEATLRRACGPLLEIMRMEHPFVDMRPSTGRMPLATGERG